MSLAKLLATGRSLIGSNEQGRYRANPRIRLPKFVSPKNPFMSAPNKECSPARTVSPEQPAQSLSPQAAVDDTRAATTGLPVANAARVSVRSFIAWIAGAAGRLNPFAWRPASATSAIPNFNRPATQPELVLEKIRVVRNDLSDADMEAAPMTAVGEVRKPAASKAFDRLAEQMAGAGQT